jgi:hypothetical protein
MVARSSRQRCAPGACSDPVLERRGAGVLPNSAAVNLGVCLSFVTEHPFDWTLGRDWRLEIEQFRRSVAMLRPGARDAVGRGDALQLLAELTDVQGRLDGLKPGCGSWPRRDRDAAAAKSC